MSISGDSGPARTRRALKVLNNNVVITIDESGSERVLMGRGLGFQLKPSDDVDPAKVEKTFVLDDGPEGERERRLLADASYAVIEAVSRAVDEAERTLGRHLGRRLAIPVIDHVQFLLERLDSGTRIPSAAMPELRVLHPQEFSVARRMAESMSIALGRELPVEEAAFLCMHVLNVTRDEPDGTAALLLRRVQHIARIVESGLGVTLDTDSHAYARFILHVQFLLQRMVDRSMLTSSDTSFYEFARHSYPCAQAVAERVNDYVRGTTGSSLTDEELLYLIVHVERLRTTLPEETGPGGVVL